MSHLLKNPPQLDNSGDGGYFAPQYLSTPNNAFKFEGATSPGASGWSPGIPTASPINQGMDQSYGIMNGGNQFNLAQSGPRQNYQNKMESTTSRMPDKDSPPEKRQRLNPSGGF
jgi:hypothetical protein